MICRLNIQLFICYLCSMSVRGIAPSLTDLPGDTGKQLERGSKWASLWEAETRRPEDQLWGLWMCSVRLLTPILDSNHSHFHHHHFWRRQEKVFFVGLGISLAWGSSSFRFVKLKKCICSLKTWCSLSNYFKTLFFWKIQT